jgi:hypothetical protein
VGKVQKGGILRVKRKNLIFWLIVVFGGVFLLGNPLTQNLWFMQLEFLDPQINHKIAAKWEGKSSEFLLGKAGSLNDTYSAIATGILLNRKEKRLEPIALKMTMAWNPRRRWSAFETLGSLGDERAIEPLMKVVRRGRKDKDYMGAVYGLSLMHCDLVFPEIQKMAEDGYETALGVAMIQRYPDKPETLLALKKIAEKDPESYVREDAQDAIKKIGVARVNSPALPATK